MGGEGGGKSRLCYNLCIRSSWLYLLRALRQWIRASLTCQTGLTKNTECMTGMRAVISRIYHDAPEKATKARSQFMVFKNRTKGIFAQPGIWEDAKHMPAHEWWEQYGAEIEELQFIAMKVLSKRSSACSVERLWSFFGSVWSDQRAKLGPKKAVELVKVGSNLRLMRKLEKLSYETEMRSWLVDPDGSDEE